MKIFGIEIKKANDLPTPADVGLIDAVTEFTTLSNNQLRGILNEKAKEYNYETLEYYFGLAIQAGIEAGIEIEQQSQINQKVQEK